MKLEDRILNRFLWYADRENWPDDAHLTREWHVHVWEFLAYVSTETNRWGLDGNGSESSQRQAKYSTVHHYYRVLKTKTMYGARVYKVYDTAQTPYQRLLKSVGFTEADREQLAATHHYLNPVLLLKQINENLESLWKLAEQAARALTELHYSHHQNI
jgi:hypothetical protein